ALRLLSGGAAQVFAAALDDVGAVPAPAAALHRDLQWGLEVVRNALEVALGRRAEEPHQQEERHHRSHEVGVRDLPGPAVMRMRLLLLAPYDNRALGVVGHGHGISRSRAYASHAAPARRTTGVRSRRVLCDRIQPRAPVNTR